MWVDLHNAHTTLSAQKWEPVETVRWQSIFNWAMTISGYCLPALYKITSSAKMFKTMIIQLVWETEGISGTSRVAVRFIHQKVDKFIKEIIM